MEDSQKFRLTSKEPLGRNPFQQADHRHDGWVAASRIARKNLMLYNSALLDRRPAADAPPQEIETWWCEMITGRFAIIGSAAVAVFGSTDEGIAECEGLLDHFAEFALAQAEKLMDGRIEKGRLLHDVRTKVIQYRENIVGKALELAEKETAANEAGCAPAGSAELPLPGLTEVGRGAIPLERPSRSEIDKSAGKAFAVDRTRILAEYEAKLNHLTAHVGLTGNSGGYLPALIRWGEERVREMILAWVDAYVEAFTSFGAPSDTRAETDLKAFAQQTAAASIAAIRGQLQLRSIRLRIAEEGSGVPWHLEIERAMGAAVDGGLLRLERQRIKFRDTDKPLQPRFTTVARTVGETAASTQAFGGMPRADEVAPAQPATAANADPPERGKPGSVHKPDKGNVGLLRGTDGKLKRAVTLDSARRFGGVSRRAIEKAAKKGSLESAGEGPNRRIVVKSLLKYFPPENTAN
jgi:hypothetical protein